MTQGRNPFQNPQISEPAERYEVLSRAAHPKSTLPPTWEPATAPAHYAHGLPAAALKKATDQRKRSPTCHLRNIPPATQEQLARIAQEMEVALAEVVRYLLEWGLTQIAQGELALQPELQPGGLTLYPNKPTTAGRRRSNQRKKSARERQGLVVRGIPALTLHCLKQIADQNGIPVWQVQRRLLEHGVASYTTGHLKLKAYATRPSYSLFPE